MPMCDRVWYVLLSLPRGYVIDVEAGEQHRFFGKLVENGSRGGRTAWDANQICQKSF